MVRTLKSVISAVSGRAVPGFTAHSLSMMEKSRSTFAVGCSFGWITNIPIKPIPICTISSKRGWYMKVPAWRSVNSYLKVLPGSMRR